MLTIEVFGELDMANAETLDLELQKAEASDAKRIVLSLAGLDFIDSTGLRILVLAARRAALDSNRLGVLQATGQVAEVLALTGVERMLPLLD